MTPFKLLKLHIDCKIIYNLLHHQTNEAFPGYVGGPTEHKEEKNPAQGTRLSLL